MRRERRSADYDLAERCFYDAKSGGWAKAAEGNSHMRGCFEHIFHRSKSKPLSLSKGGKYKPEIPKAHSILFRKLGKAFLLNEKSGNSFLQFPGVLLNGVCETFSVKIRS